MNKFLAISVILLCVANVRAADKPNPTDFTIKAHISGTRLTTECGSGVCRSILYADSVLNGKKIELSGISVIVSKTVMLIVPGDYQLKLIKDIHNSDSTLFNQEYDLLLPDNIVWRCYTTRISE